MLALATDDEDMGKEWIIKLNIIAKEYGLNADFELYLAKTCVIVWAKAFNLFCKG